MRILPALILAALLCPAAPAADPWVSYPGGVGPGAGKHVVLVSGDEEYRSEEALPMLAKVLSTRHGFRTTVLFAVDPKDGRVQPNVTDNIPGLEHLASADLLVLFTRMRKLPDDQMRHFVDYLAAGKPVVGLRTSTHAFATSGPEFGKWGHASKVKGFEGGFGRVVLGETWVSHHGAHGKQGTRGVVAPGQADSPVLRGVDPGSVFGPTDVYEAKPPADATPLLLGEVTETLTFDSNPVAGKKNAPMMPVAWTKPYTWDGGKPGKAFTTTLGASQDLAHEGTRRFVVNGCFWALGLDVPAKADVSPVGEYKPTPFGFKKDDAWKPGKTPAETSGQ